MKTFGETLQAARTARGWSVEKLAQASSVQAHWITAYENNDTSHLPPQPFRTGYVGLLAHTLGANTTTWTALARRDIHAPRTASSPTPIRLFKFRLSPLVFSRLIFVLIMSVGILWLTWQWGALTSPPPLNVQTPLPYEVVSSPVVVQGSADPQATLTLNGQLLALDQQGNFRTELSLESGEHVLVLQARDQQGRHSEKTLFFTVE